MSRILILCFLFLWSFLNAQNDIKGKIIDRMNGEAIEYATVTLHSPIDSSLLDGLVTDEKGVFEFKKINNPSVYLSVQFMGYETYYSEVIEPKSNFDFGIVSIGISSATLAEIEVSGKAMTSMHKLDKQVYDAGQFQNAKGGTATDILKNLPSVTINSFGEIAVRGSTGFLVMINGKAIQTSPEVILQQLSANSIEDIEIITAPSAKYDPDGKAGIINIKTKQGAADGLFLIANVLYGLPSIERYDNKNKASRYGADISLNFNKNQWEVSTRLDYRRSDISGRREGYVNTYLNETLTEFPSDGERSFDEKNYAARISTIYRPNQKQAITAGFYAGKRTKERTADILYNQQRRIIQNGGFLDTETYWDSYNRDNQLFTGGTGLNEITFFNENLRVRKGDFFIGSLDYAIQFDNQASLKFSGLYERTILGGPTDNVSLDYPNTSRVLQLQFNDNDNPLDGIRFKIDYAKKLGEATWEMGYQFRYLKHPGDFEYFDRDLVNNVWVENPLFTNSIELTRSIHSVYGQVAGKKDKWQYTIGLRAEYFDRQVDITRPIATFNLDRFNLFPSINLGYDIAEGLKAKLGYSKRIQRTTTFKMTPFPEREHSETLEQGDAELLPEYVDLVEAGLVKNWGDNSVFMTLYFRHIDNVINRVNTIFNDTILNRIYTNVGVANVRGLELGTTLYPANKWRVYLGGNIYNYEIKGQLFEDDINTSSTIYSINANTNYSFSPTFDAQLGLNYISERVTAQGQDSRFYNPYLTLRKTFMDKKLALALQWKNIDLGLLDANEQRITTVKDNFYTTTNYVYEVDIIQLSLTYQLNQATKKMNLPQSEFGKQEF